MPVVALVGVSLFADVVAATGPARRPAPAAVVEARPTQPAPGTDTAGRSLIEAVQAGNTAAVRALLRQGTDADAQAVDGTTALHWAAHRDDLDAADLLIRAGANVEATNRYGVAPLALACLNGNAAMIETLLNAGADPNATQPGGETALMTASRTGRVGAVQVLLDRGADPNARERSKGQTALMWAAAENNAEVLRALVAAGADLHARSNTSLDLTPNEPGDKGFTALLFAARAGRIEAVSALLEAGGDVNDTLSDGTSALVLATLSAQYDMGVFLLEQGADPNAAEQGWTALHQVAWTRRPSRGPTTVGPVARGAVDSLTLAAALVAHGADPNSRITKEAIEIYVGRNRMNRLGATPFFMAASRVDVAYMRLLARSGADPFLPNDDGTTPLMAAAGVGLWFPGESPGTPEEAAAAVEFCLELGGDATTVDANGDTALHGAAYWDSPRALELLVAAGARLDVENDKGWTPLRIADGVAITASIHISADAADTLRRMRKERGLPVPEPTLGVAK
ncbi:MAG: ankyrin repeat domain-containing protein [Acidobacteria bacterium]|nr:ankyrin repeat domain-containing protein [Acidobacteriota bacterium]